LVYVAIRRWGWLAVASIFVSSVAYSLILHRVGHPRLAKQLPGQMQFFVAGMALYLYGSRLRVNAWVSALIAVGFLAAWTFVQPIPDGIRPLIVAAFVHTFALSLPSIPLRSDLSYSVYLIHGPLIQTLIVLGVFQDNPWWIGGIVIAVLTLAAITERLIERPGTELGRVLSSRMVRGLPMTPSAAS
jgi:peptidoglycan/LPS O-acetylase OafA/YrhL